MFKNMKIGMRMGWGFAVLLLLMVVLILVSVKQMEVGHDKLQRIVKINNVRISLANDMAYGAQGTAIDVRGTLLAKYRKKSGESIRKNADDLALHRKNYQEAVVKLKEMIPKEDTKGQEMFRAAESAREVASPLQDRVIALALAGKPEAGTDFMADVAYPSVLTWVKSLDELVRYNEEYNALRYKQAEEAQHEARWTMFALGAIALGLAAGIGVFLTLGIVRPLRRMAEIAAKVGRGELDDRIGVVSGDEIGDLAASFDLMIDNLALAGEALARKQQEMGAVRSEISEGVNVLASSSSQMLAMVGMLSTSSAETATAISETTTTMEEVKQTSRQVSQRAGVVSETAQNTARASEAGIKAVEGTIDGMGKIKEQMDFIAGSIVKLSEQSQAIGAIISSVNDLANQSNLLAVNASIEAAKAGEQGKGFAVVAQEVRSLANQSKEATTQVRTILNDIQKAIGGAVMATEQGTKAVEAGLSQSQMTGESIGRISEDIVRVAQAAMQISASTNEQVAGIDQVSSAMESIKQATGQIVSSTRQAEDSTKNLHELGVKLKRMVERLEV